MTHERERREIPTETTDAPVMSAQEYFLLGMNEVVYIRSVDAGESPVYGVFPADGTQFAYAQDPGEAAVWAHEQDLEHLIVH